MFVESVDMVDVLLEGIKAISVLVLFFIITQAGNRYPQLKKGSWKYITFGFFLMFLGFVADTSDEIINYDMSPWLSSAQSFFEEGTLIIGLILVTIGFKQWFEFVGRFLGLNSQRR